MEKIKEKIASSPKRDAFSSIALWQFMAFIFLLCFVWTSEILDLPAIVFGAEETRFNIYRVTDINNGIEIEATGRAIGNDKVTPVRSTIKITSNKHKIVNHRVNSGESIYDIAKKYNVAVGQLMSWNNNLHSKIEGVLCLSSIKRTLS